jgi:PAS domain S-box-containing protein
MTLETQPQHNLRRTKIQPSTPKISFNQHEASQTETGAISEAIAEAPNQAGPSQQAVAEFGFRVLSSSIGDILNDASRTVREVLNVPMTGFGELMGDGSWVRQHYTTEAGTVQLEDPLDHYNIESFDQIFAEEPIFQILDWSNVTIPIPSELIAQNVVSTLGVPVRNGIRSFGFWGVHTFTQRSFNPEEIAFVQSVANVIASALENHRITEELRYHNLQYRTLIDHFPNGTVQLFDHDLRINIIGGESLLKRGLSRVDIEGKQFHEVSKNSALVEVHMRRALTGIETRLETLLDGRWLDIHVLPVFSPDGQISGGMMMTQDIDKRKRTEEALRQSEEHLTGILDALEDVVWSANTEGTRTTFMSSAAERVYGMPSQAFVEDPQLWIDMVHPEDLERVNLAHEKLLSDGEYNLEYRIIRPDAEVRWLSDRGRPVLDAQGQTIRIDGIASDVTARKRDELALKLREEQYRILVKNLPDELVLLFDRHLRITAAGGTLLSRLGLHPDELEGQSIFALNPHLPKDIQRLCTRTTKGEAVHRNLKHQGLELDLHIIPILDEDGGFSSGMMLAHDVTEHTVAAEIEARHQRELERMFDGIQDAFISLDRDGRFLRLNLPALKFFGVEGHNVIGKLVSDVLSGEDSFAAHIVQAVRNNKAEVFEGFITQTGTWYSARIFPIERGFVLYVVDTSEARAREAAATAANRQLEWRITQLAALHEADALLRERLRATDEVWMQTFDQCAYEARTVRSSGRR